MTPRKKILFAVTRSDTFGGVHAHIRSVISSMSSDLYEFHLVAGYCSHDNIVSRFQSSISHHRLRYFFNRINIVHDALTLRDAIILLFRLRPNLVSIHSSKAGIIFRLACFLTRTPCCYTIHGWSVYSTKSPISFLAYFSLEFFLRNIGTHLFVSEADYLYGCKTKLTSQASSIVYNTTSLTHPSAGLLSRSSQVLEPHILRLLSVSRFSAQKDHMSLLLALSLLPSHVKVELVLIGDGPLLPKFQDLAHSLSLRNIHFAGHMADLANEYLQADVFILSSFYEGLPISIIDALSCGLPVISTNVGGCSEMVFDEFNGFLVPIRSPFQIARHILYFYQNPSVLQTYAENSNYVYESLFSPQRFSQRINSAYSKILRPFS
ncbi:hypothetical protein CWE17_07160 [Synechococcus sp. BS56D]|uniref:glycosyltransferase n=1 Tax=Synechococcus sp. BS56D TaxID=2055944 RepID=UPI0010403CC9|nr:glycosyltransferase [Synechococcus sp. BS56D]TCD57615.1 hypothetical protein CWE17_07160 [Synechococcus sp. BS56D]